MDLSQLAKQYVQNNINAFLPYVNTAPTSFAQTLPFNSYFNQNLALQQAQNEFDPYYQQLLSNYYQTAAARTQGAYNDYTYNQDRTAGSFQGRGIGSSSVAQGASNYNTGNYLNQQQQQNLQNQSYSFNQNQNEQKDITDAYNNAYNNANQAYNSMMNNYYQNYNYINPNALH